MTASGDRKQGTTVRVWFPLSTGRAPVDAAPPAQDAWRGTGRVLVVDDEEGVREVATRLTVDVAVLHLGGVRFPVTGPARYTMTAHDAVGYILAAVFALSAWIATLLRPSDLMSAATRSA